ncbi:MAG: sigma-70 family RNA polymerase sigma factor [Phycisphaeraceae bacterium]|nr:sigma-70 family RNA polymerase sigma factor [Phycisphaeraceae bacterium]
MTNDPNHFTSAFLRAERALRAFLLIATGDHHVVDDLIQNVAADLWRKWAEYDGSRPFQAWAIGVARIEVLRWRRSVARDRLVLDEESLTRLAEVTDRLADEADRRRTALSGCLSKVKPKDRYVLTLKYSEQMSCRQIAQKVGKTVAAVEMVLTRTRQALRDCIGRTLIRSDQP